MIDQEAERSTIVVADTSVLINFLRIDRMDLLAALQYRLIATDHVAAEISGEYADHRERFERALSLRFLVEERVTEPDEIDLFLRLGVSEALGAGERAAIAVAINRGYSLALDDERAIREGTRFARTTGCELTVLRTQDVMVRLIRLGALSLEEADRILADWAHNHRYRRKFVSFAQLL